MYPFNRNPVGTITLNLTQDVGQRRFLQLQQNTFFYMVFLTLRVTVVVAGAVLASVRNKGSAAAAFDLVGINENGFDRVLVDPRVGAFIGQMRAMSGLSSTRLASTAIATYNLVETVPIFFANPNQLNPGETAFRERNPSAFTQAFVQLSATAAANIGVIGGGTIAVSAASVDVYQLHNPNQKQLPWFVPFISQSLTPVVGTNTNFRIPLMTDRYLASLIISQDAVTVGEVADIILSFRVLSDIRTYIGPNFLSMDNAQRISELAFGGFVDVPAPLLNPLTGTYTYGAHTGLDFIHHGQLSTMIEPNETNLRIEASVQLTAAPGAGASNIRVTTIEMVRDLQQYAGPGGGMRVVCNPQPLPWIAAA